jgi:DNA-directed RNA polymerase specialized sigma24 family protein
LGDDHGLPDARIARPEDDLIHREQAEVLKKCMDKLPPQVATLVRSRLSGEDYAAICESLKLESTRAYKLFHDAKSQLRSCVEQSMS